VTINNITGRCGTANSRNTLFIQLSSLLQSNRLFSSSIKREEGLLTIIKAVWKMHKTILLNCLLQQLKVFFNDLWVQALLYCGQVNQPFSANTLGAVYGTRSTNVPLDPVPG